MTPSEIKPGMTFGNWLVIKYDHSNKHRVKYFLCQCQVCGSYRPVRGTSLIDGSSTACSDACRDSLIDRRFGKWTVLRIDKSRPRYYICRCDCGTVKSVYSGSLKAGTTKSCGCLKIQRAKENNEQNAANHIGEKYGMLTIYDYVLKGKDYWYSCKCDCGNDKLVLGKRLFNGTTQSCGCINSWANAEMENILKRHGIRYKREYKIEECKDKYPLPFDFAVFNKADELVGLIENQGSQHYSIAGFSSHAYDDLMYIQKHDRIKQYYCDANHIPLLVIPYQYFDELEKFLTTSDFWQIIIRNFNDYEPSIQKDSEERA